MVLSTRRVVIGDEAENIVLEVVKGSDLHFTVFWKDSLGAIVPITAAHGKIADDEDNIVLPDFATVTTLLLNGGANIILPAASTTLWPETDHGSWDFTVTTASEIKTIIMGSVIIKKASG